MARARGLRFAVCQHHGALAVAALAAILAPALVCPRAAHAGNGIALVGQSVAGAGRGGAVTAVADDALSAAHNPALITQFDRIRFDGTVLLFLERVRERTAFEDESSETLTPLAPILGVAWDPFAEEVVLDGEVIRTGSDIRLAFGLYQPVSLVLAPSVTVAARVSDTVSFGATLNVLLTYLSFESDGSIGGAGGANDFVPRGDIREHYEADGTPITPPRPFTVNGEQVSWAEVFDIVNSGTAAAAPSEDDGDDAETDIEVNDVFGAGLAGNFGVTWRPHPDLTLGLSARTPGIIFNPRGTGKIDLTKAIAALREDPQIGLLLDAVIDTYLPDRGRGGLKAEYDVSADRILLPPAAAFGVAWWPFDSWLIALDVRWIGWSHAFTELDLKAEGGENNDFNEINGGPTIRHTFRLDWKDQWILALGTSLAVTDRLVLRAGYNFGSNPIPKETMSANSLPIEHHLACGAGLYLGAWKLDAAYVYGLPVEHELDDSVFKAEQHVVYLGVGYQW